MNQSPRIILCFNRLRTHPDASSGALQQRMGQDAASISPADLFFLEAFLLAWQCQGE